ncbi:NAD(P)/FAD-dependent oxidoreductase (plasmid) [Cereibacter azotoformans]|uniref:NAD(P)/FAD-dependent oxidoreductase n=1 Tax=Cereibacter azotoformans TaxID=43057 RepID=UPI003B215B2A
MPIRTARASLRRMDSDFLIIGGGIAGVSAASRLSELGSVTLLEAEEALAHHASGRSAALYEPRYGRPSVVELSLASGDFFHGAEGVLSPRGLLVVGREPERARFEAEAQGMHLERIPAEAARAEVPILRPDITLAARASHAHDIDTDLLLQRFAREARGRGAQIRTKARVSAIARDGTGWRVSADQEYRGRILVNAAGAWADQVAAMAGVRPLGLVPYRRSMARIPAPGGHDVSRWPMIFGVGESWYAKPDAGALIVSPADEDPQEPHDAWADDMVLAEGLARYEEMVTEPVTRLLASWAGLRTFAPDRVLVIGEDPAAPGFFWLAGQGGYGFQTCPAASRLVADLAGGRPPEVSAALVAALSPARFG